MTPGKVAAQAGHAYLSCWLEALQKNPSLAISYAQNMGVKICLKCDNLGQLLLAENAAKEAGIPFFRVIDSGCPNFFDGKPIVTALGLGPVTRPQVQHITKKMQLL